MSDNAIQRLLDSPFGFDSKLGRDGMYTLTLISTRKSVTVTEPTFSLAVDKALALMGGSVSDHLAADMLDWKDERVEAARELVRDLEAAPQPERRTITRKQYEMAVGRISSSRDELSASVCALICLREWDLTVEDA